VSKRAKRQIPTRLGVPQDVAAINREIEQFMDQLDEWGNKVGNYTCGVYAFFDYDTEPIYVGQTVEKIRGRISRHLTNRRTDAVAMSVLDPFEVAYIEVYPFPGLDPKAADTKTTMAKAEFTLYLDVMQRSQLRAVLNEKEIPATDTLELPQGYRAKIIPNDIFALRNHPDIRLARRASTVANLARIISERDVKPGIRRTLLTQAQRIELLARRRLNEFAGEDPGVEEPGENTGEDD